MRLHVQMWSVYIRIYICPNVLICTNVLICAMRLYVQMWAVYIYIHHIYGNEYGWGVTNVFQNKLWLGVGNSSGGVSCGSRLAVISFMLSVLYTFPAYT